MPFTDTLTLSISFCVFTKGWALSYTPKLISFISLTVYPGFVILYPVASVFAVIPYFPLFVILTVVLFSVVSTFFNVALWSFIVYSNSLFLSSPEFSVYPVVFVSPFTVLNVSLNASLVVSWAFEPLLSVIWATTFSYFNPSYSNST